MMRDYSDALYIRHEREIVHCLALLQGGIVETPFPPVSVIYAPYRRKKIVHYALSGVFHDIHTSRLQLRTTSIVRVSCN